MKPTKVSILVSFLILFAAILFALPRVAKLSIEYTKGQPWKYETLVAPFDFPILKTEEQILKEMSEASSSFVPYYKYDSDVAVENLKKLEDLDMGAFNYMKGQILAEMTNIYDVGIVADGIIAEGSGEIPPTVYVQKGKRATSVASKEIYTLADAKEKLLDDMKEVYPNVNLDTLLQNRGVYDLLVPVLTYDSQTTDLVKSENRNVISPTAGYVSAGQLIISKGEVVSAETEQILDSYKKEYETNIGYDGPEFLLWLGNGIIALVLVVLLFFAIYFVEPDLFKSPNRLNFVLVIAGIFMVATILVARTSASLLYLLPFTLCPLLMQPFFDKKLIFAVYGVALLPLLVCADHGVALYFMFLAAGVVSIYIYKFFHRGWKQFVAAIITYAVLMLVYMGFRCVDMVDGSVIRASLYLFAAAMLPIAGYPLTYLFERIFNMVSPSRLLELSETTQPLLQELEKKAPGTFQHSLQVANMADACARAIGADVQLVRVGALYHDIGKMRNPLCFTENANTLGVDEKAGYHASLSPLQSASDIIRHVTDGVEIAKKHHLPSPIIGFIRTHHGTQRQAYFYDKYLKAGGDPANVAEFEYPGIKPRTKEEIILMLSDSVEAASRSALKEYTAENFDSFVEIMVDGKLEQGQFEDAEITVKDLETVKATLKSYLSQLYHARIEYPKQESKKDKNKKI